VSKNSFPSKNHPEDEASRLLASRLMRLDCISKIFKELNYVFKIFKELKRSAIHHENALLASFG
jgi:hypothetical protein